MTRTLVWPRWLPQVGQAASGPAVAAGRATFGRKAVRWTGLLLAAALMVSPAGIATANPTRAMGHLNLGGHHYDITAGAVPSLNMTGAQPQFVMHTLTVTANDINGSPDDTGSVLLYNTDDGYRVNTLLSFYHGAAKFSVPDGHYAAVATFFDADAVREVSEPEFTVTADRSVNLDEAKATSLITMVTDRPAVAQETGFVFRRAAPTGPSLYWDVVAPAGMPFWIAPTGAVSTGTLQTYPHQRLTSPSTATPAYEYDLQIAAVGSIPQQHYVIHDSGLATVDSRYFSDQQTTGLRQLVGVFSFERGENVQRDSYPFAQPTHQTLYLSAGPDIGWYGGVAKAVSVDGVSWVAPQYADLRHYQPGTTVQENWNSYPLHPGGHVNTGNPDGFPVPPAATRAGDMLSFDIMPFGDNQPGHIGIAQGISTWELDQDGVKIADQNSAGRNGQLQASVPVSTNPATMHLTLDSSRSGPSYVLATAAHTEWTWRSAHEEGSTLPDPLVCGTNVGGTQDRNCAVEPLLSLDYAVVGERLDGSTIAGSQSVDLNVGHLQYATPEPITGVQAQFSIDGGATWADTSVVGTNGNYRLTFPVSGGTVSLRVAATDAVGGQITETTIGAFTVQS